MIPLRAAFLREEEGEREVVNKNVTRISPRKGVSRVRPRDASAFVDLCICMLFPRSQKESRP